MVEKKKHAGGAPSKKTPELIDKFLDATMNGYSLTKTCKEVLHISVMQMYRWIQADAQLCEDYTRCSQYRADTRADKVDEILDDLRAGKIDPNTARVMIDAIKWQAAHERPKKYGDRITQEHTGEGGGPVSVTVNFVKSIPKQGTESDK
jgi:hypothetical protein